MDEELLKLLLAKDYAVIVGDKPVLTKKFFELFPVETVVILNAPKVATDTKAEKQAVWNKFITDAQIPHRVSDQKGGVYTVRQFSILAATKLLNIVRNPEIDYSILVEATKNYYKTVTYKHLLSNYLLKDTWKSEYDYFISNKQKNKGEEDWRFT